MMCAIQKLAGVRFHIYEHRLFTNDVYVYWGAVFQKSCMCITVTRSVCNFWEEINPFRDSRWQFS